MMDQRAEKQIAEMAEAEQKKRTADQAQCCEIRRASLITEYRAERDHLFSRISVLTEMIRDLENDPMFAEKMQRHMDLRNRHYY